MFKVKQVFVFMIGGLFLFPLLSSAQNVTESGQPQPSIIQNNPKPVVKEAKKSKPLLKISPEEIHLGIITADDFSSGTFTLRNVGGGVINWSTDGPRGWKKILPEEQNDPIASVINRFDEKSEETRIPGQKKISGVLEETEKTMRVGLKLLPDGLSPSEGKIRNTMRYVQMRIQAGENDLFLKSQFSMGSHKEEIKINSSQGQRTVCVHFTIAYIQKFPLIHLNPLRLDMGGVQSGKTVSRKIILNNIGQDMLTWSVGAADQKGKNDSGNVVKKEKYISFLNEATKDSGIYTAPGPLKDAVELTGEWTEFHGYPSCDGGENKIKVKFRGTGIILYLLKYPEDGNVSLLLDKRAFDGIELLEELKENSGEILVAEKLENENHTLTITCKDSPLVLEGIKILGQETMPFPERSIRIFPNSGATTRQTNYLTVSLNTDQMLPGYYAGDIVFKTNGGETEVEIFADVLSDTLSKILDVYRYFNGADYMYVADVQSEIQRIIQNSYVKEGIAFRLFVSDTPGTIAFYRWYNPQKRCHFYHHDQSGGGKDLRGYVLEGSIGNIATSKLTNTRELYRWYNTKTGRYFYSTDIQGGKINKKIYRFEGIAGYVR